MEIKQIKIGQTLTANNVFLAPMAGYTDYAFRKICLSLGAGMAFTELTSAKGIIYDSKNTKVLLKKSDSGVTGAQLFGSEPDVVKQACLSEWLAPYDIIDINMGCPVPKVYKNGEGSALLKDVLKAESVVKAAVSSGKTITVKIRIGLSENSPFVTEEFAKMAEASGAKLLTVHGRTRERYYSGDIHFEEIFKAKNAVNIPVIANGGIFTTADADEIISKTGADGVMLARGAIADPYLFSKLIGKTVDLPLETLINNQLDFMLEDFSDRFVTVNIRKFFVYYFKGKRNMKELCKLLYTAQNTDEVREILHKNLHICSDI
ncbi:MAG: tRNA-dihydrouridine synthase family protein [Clostridia bacterium]|nr:tRNA-dihydrouridine synthase family protein [Clostridia bacterium]